MIILQYKNLQLINIINMLKEASFYIKKTKGNLQCSLCPHYCQLKQEQKGICKVRKNIDGKLFTENYSKLTSIHIDPVEKKPLYHFYPGKNILSIGSFGCNLQCVFCQNHEISQRGIDSFSFLNETKPETVIKKALSEDNNIGIAYTYNEPIIFYEYMYDTALIAKEKGLKNIMVSNGFINTAPLEKIIGYIDAFNIDLKAFTENFYSTQTKSKLKNVLDTIETIIKHKKHIEITNLIIPGINDYVKDFERMINYLREVGGKSIVLHLSRYFPNYKSHASMTDSKTINNLYKIAKKQLNFVYIGNIQTTEGQNTYCPECGNILIDRKGNQTKVIGLNKNICRNCSTKIETLIT